MDVENDFLQIYKKILKFGYDPADDAYKELEKNGKYWEGRTEDGLSYCVYAPPQKTEENKKIPDKMEILMKRYQLLKQILQRVENSDDISWNDVSRHYERIKQEYLHLQELLESVTLNKPESDK
ncbi:MAG TPA: hypothetical protein VKY57_14435 [Chitinispirillaceae bacterium]|jgi:hypothetical protein|nr:hypothetical protein [Chitinispirillaceae bacterium]